MSACTRFDGGVGCPDIYHRRSARTPVLYRINISTYAARFFFPPSSFSLCFRREIGVADSVRYRTGKQDPELFRFPSP